MYTVTMPAELRIGELARRTGVSSDLLRAWERRYGLLRPERSTGGYRLYSAEDEQRVRAMTGALGRGISAGEAALKVYAFEDAGAHFGTARELAVTPVEEYRALAGLGDAGVGLGRPRPIKRPTSP